jgi:hypothetical protein
MNNIKIHRLGLNRNQYVENRFLEMIDFWKDCNTFNFIDLEDVFCHSIYDDAGINSPAKQLKSRTDVDYIKNINVIQMHIMFNIYKYITLLYDFIEDRIGFYDLFHNDKYFMFYSALANVKTYGEYIDWREDAIKKFKFVRATNIMKFDNSKNTETDFLF